MSDLPSKGPDFSKPIEALKACHARIRLECDRMCELVEHMKAHGCDAEARQAAAKTIRPTSPSRKPSAFEGKTLPVG